jgi:prepilin-type N-terminal cleavage/methylation domain-containing protein
MPALQFRSHSDDTTNAAIRHLRGVRAFTLIEILVVVVIIVILVGITFKMTSFVNQKIGRGRTAWEIEQIKIALAEYYGAYGSFPPASQVRTAVKFESNPTGVFPDDDTLWRTGLTRYLDPFVPAFNALPHETKEAYRWWKYVKDFISSDITHHDPDFNTWYRGHGGHGGYMHWRNMYYTILDAWEQELHYISRPPYQSYKLWSDGPSANPNDDIGDRWAE